jgi:hypothetical protein
LKVLAVPEIGITRAILNSKITLVKNTMTKLIYTDVHSLEWNDAEIWNIVKQNDQEALLLLPMKLGFNHKDWRFVQNICVVLSEHKNESIRGNSFYGLGYAAMTHRKLEKNIVKPILLRGLKDPSEYVRQNAQTVIDDVNRIMKWKIGSAPANKLREKSYYERVKNNH